MLCIDASSFYHILSVKNASKLFAMDLLISLDAEIISRSEM